MHDKLQPRPLFIVNPGSGTDKIDWSEAIRNYFTKLEESFKLFELHENCKPQEIKDLIKSYNADRVIAVGGDGTVNLVAQCVIGSDIPMGILPAGSANGMAKELGIPADPEKAIAIAMNGEIKIVHAVKLNGQLSLHLSDVGFNAYVVKKFKSYSKRGMWSYVKAAWQVARSHRRIGVKIKTDEGDFKRRVIMVVIANATKYGSGAVINPEGNLSDNVFEVVVIKRFSLFQSFMMLAFRRPYDPKHSEIFSTRSLVVETRPMHFQVDGEYLGKTTKVEAEIIPGAIKLIIPAEKEEKAVKST